MMQQGWVHIVVDVMQVHIYRSRWQFTVTSSPIADPCLRQGIGRPKRLEAAVEEFQDIAIH